MSSLISIVPIFLYITRPKIKFLIYCIFHNFWIQERRKVD